MLGKPEDEPQLLRHRADDEKFSDAQTEADAKDTVDGLEGVPLAVEQLGPTIYGDEVTISGLNQLSFRVRLEEYGLTGSFWPSQCEVSLSLNTLSGGLRGSLA